MAPRRPTQQRDNQLASGLSDLFLADHSADSAFESAFESSNSDSSMAENHRLQRCCVPQGDCLKNNTLEFGLINLDDLTDTVRIMCSNDGCNVGQYMHRECFDQWEQGVLSYLKSIGRARSWSDKQRQQNLWNKKGYDLVYKACGCRCGRGHIKKNLDWSPPASSIFGGSRIEEENKKKKRRNRNNQKPILSTVATSPNAYHPNQQMMKINTNSIVDNMMHNLLDNSALTVSTPQTTLRGRAGSLSSSTGSSSPPFSTSEQSISPVHNTVMNKQKQKEQTEIYSDRVRATSGANGIFSRRLDFSSFNMLAKQRINSYSIKIEDEGNHGNDETRLFILSSLAAQHKSKVACVLCEEPMLVFDRYPLVDGTFFLSPKQHNKGCIEVKYEGRQFYLTSVCMDCLDGTAAEKMFRCQFCNEKWDGSSLVMGTMYSYDIFAAMPCCTERLKCNSCCKLLLHPNQRLNFFSDYSHAVTCPYCQTHDTHFIKPLTFCYTNKPAQLFQQWP